MSYQNHMMELCEHVVQAVAMSLGYDQHFFDEWVQDPMCYYKMIHYPPPSSDKDNGKCISIDLKERNTRADHCASRAGHAP
jgi:isopenicillin N synthase-like dioxygenase